MDIQSLSSSAVASTAYRNTQTSEASSTQDAARAEQLAAKRQEEQAQAQQQQKQEEQARPVTNTSGQVTGSVISVRA